MNPLTLRDQLLNMEPTDDEAVAAQRLADAYSVYATDAVAGSIPITPAGVELGKAAMAGALTGMSASGAGLAIIPAALVAFWAGVAAGLATSFAAAILITPPPFAGLAGAFASLMPANTSGGLSKADAMMGVATAFHSQTIVGGTATFPGVPPLVFPIL